MAFRPRDGIRLLAELIWTVWEPTVQQLAERWAKSLEFGRISSNKPMSWCPRQRRLLHEPT
jgi:hypothetical protein